MTFSNIKEQEFAAVDAVVRKWDLKEDQYTKKWYDAVNPRTGSRYEVKSTHIGGRFRFWRDDLHSIVRWDGTAWVGFVLFDSGDNTHRVWRKRARTVLNTIDQRGGWNIGGHSGRPGKQKKLKAEAVA